MSPGQAEARSASARVPVGLDAPTIVDTACALLDEVGAAAFTVRALADRLGVRAPTIYWHVGSKANLLQFVADRFVGDLAAVVATAGAWEDRLRHFVATGRRCLLAHPGALDLLRTVHTQAFEHWIVVAFGIMIDAGLDDHQAAVHARIAIAHTLSTAQSEHATRTTPYLEAVPGTRRRHYRVKPAVLRVGLPQHVVALTSFDLDEQQRTHDDILVAGVRNAPRPAAG
jgi:AcrR family transcriptional regulator